MEEENKVFPFFQRKINERVEAKHRERGAALCCVSACRAEASCWSPVIPAKNKLGVERRGFLPAIYLHLCLPCPSFLLSSFFSHCRETVTQKTFQLSVLFFNSSLAQDYLAETGKIKRLKAKLHRSTKFRLVKTLIVHPWSYTHYVCAQAAEGKVCVEVLQKGLLSQCLNV